MADHTRRLLLTDFAMQADVQLAEHADEKRVAVRSLVPCVEAAVTIHDVDVLALLVLESKELMKRLPKGEEKEKEEVAMKVELSAELDLVKASLCDDRNTLVFVMEEARVSCCEEGESNREGGEDCYGEGGDNHREGGESHNPEENATQEATQTEVVIHNQEKDTILSIKSVRCLLNDDPILSVRSLPERDLCVCVKREQREQETGLWYCAYVGDLFL